MVNSFIERAPPCERGQTPHHLTGVSTPPSQRRLLPPATGRRRPPSRYVRATISVVGRRSDGHFLRPRIARRTRQHIRVVQIPDGTTTPTHRKDWLAALDDFRN